MIKDKSEIFAVGHRVVHAGEKFNGTVPITDAVLAALKECIPLAPLHNPPNITGIEACRRSCPAFPMAGIFDTAFHQTMPENAYIYALPYDLYASTGSAATASTAPRTFTWPAGRQGPRAPAAGAEDHHLPPGQRLLDGRHPERELHRYLHGLYAPGRAAHGHALRRPRPRHPPVLQRTLGLSHEQVDAVLNRKSGMLGISEVSSDMRDINEKAAAGHAQSKLALEIFAYRIKKYIGAYIAAMNGVDLVIFTAGIGERGREEREMILSNMEFLGIEFDKQANQEAFGKFGVISAKGSKVSVMVIPTNEELEIAEQTLKVIANNLKSDSPGTGQALFRGLHPEDGVCPTLKSSQPQDGVCPIQGDCTPKTGFARCRVSCYNEPWRRGPILSRQHEKSRFFDPAVPAAQPPPVQGLGPRAGSRQRRFAPHRRGATPASPVPQKIVPYADGEDDIFSNTYERELLSRRFFQKTLPPLKPREKIVWSFKTARANLLL